MNVTTPYILPKDLTSFLVQGQGFLGAMEVLKKLSSGGYKSYLAGGCVRDALLNRPYSDIDIVTAALPEQIEALFAGQTIPVGKKFGIIIVQIQDQQIEVATFRKDGHYQDGRRPDNVEFSSEKEDALRRDFTINALFYDPLKLEIIDYVGGVVDIANKIVKTVGDPNKRFSEDYLRVLRLFRFSEVLNFNIDPATYQSAKEHFAGLEKVSAERKRDELLKAYFQVKDQYHLTRQYEFYGLWEVFFKIQKLDLPPALFKTRKEDEVSLLCVLLWNQQSPAGILKELRFSQKVIHFVTKVIELKNRFNTLLFSSEQEKRFHCLLEEFRMFLLLQQGIEPQNAELVRLYQLAQQYRLQPPKPLLNGEDLKEYFQGKDLGNALDLVFKEQLVQNWQNKKAALDWILKAKAV